MIRRLLRAHGWLRERTTVHVWRSAKRRAWLIGRFPELRACPDEETWRAIRREVLSSALLRAGVAFILLKLTLQNCAMWVAAQLSLGKGARLGMGIMVLATSLVGAGLATHVLFRRGIHRSLRRCLRKQGIPVCMNCGYCLAGRTGSVCPECGAACHDEQVERS